ncbi:caspase family protein [Streptomyces sp. Ru87]|uniref:caspase family protein n=1 Tax=Streptomyces sp. Ru87 TaxID=2044307 RepID=UPI000BFA8E94|nr:caspase family protein [Streptomyces sp. Ru87]PGH48708.1 hypothetical protein CRI70_21530 [Streptomyces sp. Ru87]
MTGDTWALRVPERARSRAVVVGTASHEHPSDLPPMDQAMASAEAFRDALVGPYGLFDPALVHRGWEPASQEDVLRLIPAAPEAPGEPRLDLLLFYYAGHGLDEQGRLCLALRGSRDRDGLRERTALPAEDVFAAMSRSRARHKVAILDCCFADRAFNAPSAAGVHLLTATTSRQKARFTPGGRLTGFTAELLALLAEGVPEGPDHLDLATVHRRLSVLLPTAGDPRPLPDQRTVGSSGDLALARNPAFGTAGTVEGLAVRSRFVLRLRRLARLRRTDAGTHREQAVRLAAGLAADAEREFSRTDPVTLAYRHLHGSLTGEAGDADTAFKLLDEVVADWRAHAPDTPGLAGAERARAEWAGRAASGRSADTPAARPAPKPRPDLSGRS